MLDYLTRLVIICVMFKSSVSFSSLCDIVECASSKNQMFSIDSFETLRNFPITADQMAPSPSTTTDLKRLKYQVEHPTVQCTLVKYVFVSFEVFIICIILFYFRKFLSNYRWPRPLVHFSKEVLKKDKIWLSKAICDVKNYLNL